MSLKVWLPLRDNLENKGISGYNINSTNTTVNENGKIGKCIKITNKTSLEYIPNFNTSSLSFGGWFKFNKSEINTIVSTNNYTSTYKTSVGQLIGNSSYGGIGLVWVTNNCYTDGSFDSISVFSTLRTSTVNNSTSSILINFDEWTHIFLVWDIKTHKLNLYKNGDLINSKVFSNFSDGVSRQLYLNYNAIYGGIAFSEEIPIYCNDIRIYDHALSKTEVKEISKALILHYKLDKNSIGNINLIKNGNFQYDMEGWTGGAIDTDVPADHPELINSVKGSSTTNYFIPIESSHTYKIEHWLKNDGNTSTYIYPSVFPYDIDFNFIYFYQTITGFSAATLTTLSQPLNPGDTVIYATDLSNWITVANNYNYAAIFGYADSTGYVYPDLVYTRTTPAFHSGSSTPKTEIDKTNNTITLLSAYSGKPIPAGTSICQSAAGSTNFYPFGSVKVADISDWTYKSATFHPIADNRLKVAKYIKYGTYAVNVLNTGIKLTDLNYGNIVTDSSGYNNNGTSTGTLTTSNIGGRYSSCTHIDFGNINYITTPVLNLPGDAITLNFWFKSTNTSPGSNYHMPLEGIANSNQSYECSIYKTGYYRSGLVVDGVRKVDNCTSTKLTDGNWHMCTTTYDGTTIKRYVDAISEKDTTVTGTLVTSTAFVLGHYGSNTSYYSKESYESDVRIYTTALSQLDIEELYHTSLKIDNFNKMHTFELEEKEDNSSIKINKNGILLTENEFTLNTKPAFYKDKHIEAKEFIER